jgi:hypothetical protein
MKGYFDHWASAPLKLSTSARLCFSMGARLSTSATPYSTTRSRENREEDGSNTNNNNKDRFNTTWPAPECGKEFAFDGAETRVSELPLSLFERRHFYRSELREP